MQWLTHHLGGKWNCRTAANMAAPSEHRARYHKSGYSPTSRVAAYLNSHGDQLSICHPGFRPVGRTHSAVAAVEDPHRKIYAVEFIPEVPPYGPRHRDPPQFSLRVWQAEKK